MTLERRTPLKRTGGLTRTAMKRKPTRNRSEIEFSPEIKAQADARAGFRCEAKTPVCTGTIRTHHHKLMKSHGGKGTLENCLAVCHACHVAIHRHTGLAYKMGWLIRSGPVKQSPVEP